MDTGLTEATWGLVVATILLVATAIVPLLRDFADRRESRRKVGSQIVPDLNILRSRLAGGSRRLVNGRSLSIKEIDFQIEAADGELEIISEIIDDDARPSLLFANETYLVRHFLTQARGELRRANHLMDESDVDSIHRRDDSLLRARRLYQAALTSLDAAEQELPRRVRTLKGESFWDRFNRVSTEREAEAGRSFIES